MNLSMLVLVTIVAGVIGPLALKALLLRGMTYTDVVFWRSVSAITFVFLLSLSRLREFTGLISKVSLMRLIIGGTLLLLSLYAFSALSVTEVTLLLRLDLPIFLTFCATGAKRVVAALIIIIGIAYSWVPISSGYSLGVAAAWASAFLTAISYCLVRAASSGRSLPALVLPPYVGAAILVLCVTRDTPKLPLIADVPLLIITSGCAVLLYVLCAQLFMKLRMGAAELTGSISFLLTYCVEGLLIGEAPPAEAGLTAFISVLIGTVLIFWEEGCAWLKTKSYRL